MKRYLNSFFITTSIYSLLAFIFFYTISEINLNVKNEPSVKVISLNNVTLQNQNRQVEEKAVEKVEEEIKEVVEKTIEKPAKRIVEKVVEKQKPKAVEKIVKESLEKEIENPIEKPFETKEIEQKNSQEVLNQNQISQANINTLENDYLRKVQAKIEKNKEYPKISKRLNQTGKVEISFDILKDGKVTNIKILKNSKFEKLDEASIELLTRIAYFEAIPNELNKSIWSIKIPINYQLN